MKIYFLKDIALKTLKGNIDYNINNYNNEQSPKWIEEYFENENPLVEYKKEVKNFKLDMSNDKPAQSDMENSKIIYKAMMNLTESEATDERLWAGMCHSEDFWQYIQYRWNTKERPMKENEILNRLFFEKDNPDKRILLMNSLSRLWWIAKITYDETRENKFELLEYLDKSFMEKSRILLSANYTNNPMIVRSILSTLIDIEKREGENRKIKTQTFRDIVKHMNIVGGMYILDALDAEEISKIVSKKTYELTGWENKVPIH